MFLEKVKFFLVSFIMLAKAFFSPPKKIHYTEIPIIINNFNRLEYLKRLIKSLEKREYKNIIILDNQSTYPPLLEFYKQTDYKVIILDKNYGFRALWKSGIYQQFKRNYFVYTDSDLEIIDECPNDFLLVFRDILIQNKWYLKIGFSLKIDDLPDENILKDEVIAWEKKFYETPINSILYKAPIDTTFALYRPFSFKHTSSNLAKVFRTAFPYQAKHLPWYIHTNKLSEEEKYYMETTKVKSWTNKIKEKIN